MLGNNPGKSRACPGLRAPMGTIHVKVNTLSYNGMLEYKDQYGTACTSKVTKSVIVYPRLLIWQR